jgi:hypothetical protein
MSVRSLEAQAFGEPLRNSERLVAGLVALVGAAGHIALVLTAAVFFAFVLGVV